MTRKCFLTDEDGRWFTVNVDQKGFFNSLVENEDWESLDCEFGTDELNRDISDYSFDNLREIFD